MTAATAPAAPQRKPMTAAQTRAVRKVAAAQKRIDAAAAAGEKYSQVRMEAWIEARQLDPPVPWIRLAEAAGVSDAYVIREVGNMLRRVAAT